MAFNEIRGQALRDFDQQRAQQPAVVNRPVAVGQVAQNQGGAGNVRWDGTRWTSTAAPVSAASRPNSVGYPTAAPGRSLAEQTHNPSTVNRASGTGAPVTVNKPMGLGAQAPKYGVQAAPPASPQPVAQTASPAPVYRLASPAAEGLAYGASTAAPAASWRALAVFPNNPSAQAAYDEVYTSLQGIVDPADLERYATNAGQEASRGQAQGGSFGASRNNAHTPVPTYKEVPAAPVAPVGYGAFGGQRAAENVASVNRPTPAPVVPDFTAAATAPTRSDYVPPTESAFVNMPGFDQDKYRDTMVALEVGQIERGHADSARRIREEMAARGFSQQGMSGIEADALIRSNIARQEALGQARGQATVRGMEFGREDAWRRAGQIDNYGLARGGFGISYAGDNRQANREDTMLPIQAEAGRIANQGGRITNQAGQANADVATATTQARIDHIKSVATNADIVNRRAEFQLENDIAVAPVLREQASAQLRQIEQEMQLAVAKQDWAMVDQLGKLAAQVASKGGFKIAGGFLGGVVGSIVPGVGTVAGAAVGSAGGAGLDTILAPAATPAKT